MANVKRLLDTVAAHPLVRSRQRVQDHAEVLTPAWLVDDMLDLVKAESERVESRFLEPACGTGNFLIRVLGRKMATAKARYGRSIFEKRHHMLLALMSIYGIEIQGDNVAECRRNLLVLFNGYVGSEVGDEWHRAAAVVVTANIVQGDALAMITHRGEPIVFPEWGYIGKGKFQRRDFRYDRLAGPEVFEPVRSYAPMTASQIAESAEEQQDA
ncbi:restriction endonuclease subunit M [Cryobacterium sp. N21]|uniref:restriction endonuclease subunit M n=1 Tax=Cryobacterium sp. N21 TaxID=2048289 RepID=UPI000CE38D4F|nr:restriction endonuclease subunit M [Cryobacterium sp. N21]